MNPAPCAGCGFWFMDVEFHGGDRCPECEKAEAMVRLAEEDAADGC